MDLVIPKSQGIAKAKQLASVVGGGDYLAYLDFRSGKRAVVQNEGWPANTFALCKTGEATNVGNEFDAILLDVRPTAVDFNGGVDKAHNPEGARFLEIKADTDDGISGNAYGPEFLVYLPEQKEFATFHMSSKSNRKLASGKNLEMLGTVVKFNSKSVTTTAKDEKGNVKEFTYMVITMEASDLVLQDEDVDKVEMGKVMAKFNEEADNTDEAKAEEVTDEAESRTR